MSEYIIQGTTMVAIADAIRSKNSTTELLSPLEMPDKILEIIASDANVTVATVDFTNWDNGSFTETLSDGSVIKYTVTFDDSGNPISISNGVDTYSIEWGDS